MIELTQQEARTGDALKAKAQIISSVKQWHDMIQANNWILDEWDEEFCTYMRKITDPIAGSIIVQK